MEDQLEEATISLKFKLHRSLLQSNSPQIRLSQRPTTQLGHTKRPSVTFCTNRKSSQFSWITNRPQQHTIIKSTPRLQHTSRIVANAGTRWKIQTNRIKAGNWRLRFLPNIMARNRTSMKALEMWLILNWTMPRWRRALNLRNNPTKQA